MDPRRFDQLARRLGTVVSRRSVVAAMLTVMGMAGTSAADAKHKRQRAGKGRVTSQALKGLRDCPNPKAGQNLTNCDFSGVDLRGKNLRGANLSGALIEDANLCGADLRGTNLQHTDFRFANLTRVDFRGTNLSTANLDGALLCQTIRPNGTRDNSDCPVGATVCCANAECPFDQTCVNGGCTSDIGCPPDQVRRLNGSCAVPCNDDGDCATGCSCVAQPLEPPSVCMNTLDTTGLCPAQGLSIECPEGSGCSRPLCHPLCVPAS
jgi:hypothetical protein